MYLTYLKIFFLLKIKCILNSMKPKMNMRHLLLNMRLPLRNLRKLKKKIFQKMAKRNLMPLLKLHKLKSMNLRKNIKIGKMMPIK